MDNGKTVTAAGVDGALHLVARLCGAETAKKNARYLEYRWQLEEAAAPPAASR